MTFKGAVDRLGTWTVTGITTHYGMDDLVGEIPQAMLPALVVLPGLVNVKAADPLDVGLNTAVVNCAMDHLLLYSGIAQKRPQERLYGMAALVDNYFTKVKTDWVLDGHLLEPMRIMLKFDPIIYAGAVYEGVTFHHEWMLQL